MDRRTPWQHLLRHLGPSAGPSEPSAPDFSDTRPDTPEAAPPRRPAAGWAESAIDLFEGTEVMEYPDDTAADLMDEFFTDSHKRAA
jgi:hypothetical protein